jgi:hypothetical protein
MIVDPSEESFTTAQDYHSGKCCYIGLGEKYRELKYSKTLII